MYVAANISAQRRSFGALTGFSACPVRQPRRERSSNYSLYGLALTRYVGKALSFQLPTFAASTSLQFELVVREDGLRSL